MNGSIRTQLSGLLAISITLTVASLAQAAPIVDGRVEPGEGYTLGRYVAFAVEGSKTTVTGGELWVHQDSGSGDVYVAFTQPLSLVDNTYGKNSIGWGDAAPSGKNHNFKDLKGSDKAQFVFTDGLGQAVLDVTVDYISEDGHDYRCLGVSGGDGKVSTGSAGDVLEWGSSLDCNFNTLGYVLTENSPLTDDDYTENPQYVGWVFEVAYELRVSGDLFRGNGFGDVAIPIVHDSPNKIGKNKVYPDPNGEIPEPATLALLAAACPAALLRRRRLL